MPDLNTVKMSQNPKNLVMSQLPLVVANVEDR